MNTIKTLNETIDAVRPSSAKPLYLVAFSDEEEQRFKEWYPGIEILRAPFCSDECFAEMDKQSNCDK